MTTLNIISVNTRGLNSKEKRDKFYRWIIDTKLDVILIQETHFVEKYALQYECGWNGLSLHCFSDSSFSRGVSILFRKGLDINIISIHKTKDGRKLLVNLNIGDSTYSFINVYAPNQEGSRIEFFKGMRRFISNFTLNSANTILCGDFNCHMEGTSIDKSTKILKDILKYMELIDVWQGKNGNTNGYTWCDATNTPKSRIDFIFASENLLTKFKQIILRKIPGTHKNGTRMSDHRGIKFNLVIYENERGNGYWKLNTSLLECEEFKRQIKLIIKDVSSNGGSSIDKWESLKHSIKDFSIAYSVKRQKTYKKVLRNLEREISEMESLPYHLINMNRNAI